MMKVQQLILLCLLLYVCHCTETPGLHYPSTGVPSFRRDAVERQPSVLSRIKASNKEVFGDRSLPLRAAVEKVPDVIETQQRLPLRDAVESRPVPDSSITEEDIESILYGEYKHQTPKTKYGLNKSTQKLQAFPNSYNLFKGHVGPLYAQSLYSPVQFFRTIIGDYRKAAPYRTDNPNLQLLKSPYQQFAQGRNMKFEEKNDKEEKKVVCYVQGQAVYRREPLTFHPQDLNPFACTHVIYAFASLDPHTFQLTPNDEQFDLVQGGYRSVTGLKRINGNLKVLISVGGREEDAPHRFVAMVFSAVNRRDFIRSVVKFLEVHNFDGLDIHWQYPSSAEKEYFSLLLEELSEVFKPNGWILTVSAPGSRFRIDDGFDPERLAKYVDFVNVQAYNFHRDKNMGATHHASLSTKPHDKDLDIFYNLEYSIKYWIRRGLPASKLVAGIPFFGRSFTLKYANQSNVGAPIIGPGIEGYYTQTPGFLAYFEICDLISNKGIQYFVDDSEAPYIVMDNQWIAFDNADSIEKKISYVKELNLGGVFIWSADLDDFKGLCGEKWPLLNAVNTFLKSSSIEEKDYAMPSRPFGTCEQSGLYSDPNNCQAFYICRNGLNYHLACGPNMKFNPSTGSCGHFGPDKCKPGESVYIPFTIKGSPIARQRNEIDVNKPKVVCYSTSWAFYRKSEAKFVPELIDQRLCTYVVYAFASLDPETLMMKVFDPWADLDNNLFERLTVLKDVVPLLSVGGWTDSSGDKYSRLVSNSSARRRFVLGAVDFLKKYGFKGLHFDWNYPVCWQSTCNSGPMSDKPNFSLLIQELKDEFDKVEPPLILAAAISGYKEVIDVAYDIPLLSKNLEFMSVMTYDYHGFWEGKTGHVSPLYYRPGDRYPQYNTNFTMAYLVSKGAERSKLLLGIPFYGQTYTLANIGDYDQGAPTVGPGVPGEYTKQPGMLAYYEICERIRNNRWIVNRDRYSATGPYAYHGDQWVGFEDMQSVREKAKYIKLNGFGGAVAWTIDLDDFSNECCSGSFPLLKTLNKELGLIPDRASSEDCTKPPRPATPAPPLTTTGIDSGASMSTTEHIHHEISTKPSTWWPTQSSTWWSTQSTTAWWQTSTTTKATTTARRTTPMATKPPWSMEDYTSTTVPPPVVIMPEVDNPSQSCQLGDYVADQMNCNAFFRCVRGKWRKQYCAQGLHWNKETETCDWPMNAKCMERVPPTQSTTTSTTPKTTTTFSWTTQKPTTRPTKPTTRPTQPTYKPTEPSLEDISDIPCINGQYYPHEQCSSYYVCDNGRLLSQNCAPGLNWNAETQICDWPYKVKCANRQKLVNHITYHDHPHGGSIKAEMPKPYSSCNGNSFAAHPTDCNQYLHCLWGKYEVFQCAPGLHWNNDKKLCDWPDSANCQENLSNDVIPQTEGPTINPIYRPTYPTPKPTEGFYPDWKPTTRPTKPTTTTDFTIEENEPLKPQTGYFKIVCYFTNWAWYRQGFGKYLPEEIDPDLCTHVVYGFAVLDYENLIIKPHDSWADIDNKFYERVTALRAKGVKVSIAIGGWNDSMGDKYSRLVNNPAARARFIKHVMEFMEKYNFDGLDLDWEYPKCWQVECNKGPDSDKPAFAAWVKELKTAFAPKGYLLSAAVSPNKIVVDAGYDVPVVSKYLDWIAVMAYDYHGQWDKKTGHIAPMFYHPDDDVTYFNANFTMHYWIEKGASRRKLVMGMPLYGQSFQLAQENNNGLNAPAPGPGQAGEFTRANGFLAYYEICDNIKNKGWVKVNDPKGLMGPYAYKGNQWVSFDDKNMIKKKCDYIKDMDLGGGMIWALDLDDFKNRCGEGRHPLLTTIRQTLAEPGAGVQEEQWKPDVTPEITEPEKEPEKPEVTFKPPPAIEHTTIQNEVPQSTSSVVDPNSEFKVVCYFTNWAWYRQGVGKYLPSDIDTDLCTHIVYGFAVLNGDQLIIKPHDTWADFDNKFYEKVTAHKAKGVKVLIAIGGWNDSAGDKYSKLVNNPTARRRFIAHVLDFIEQNNFDGLDLDWEYPKCWQVECNKGPESDKPAFAAFVKELHEAFQPKGYLLSAAVSPNSRVVDEGYDVPTLSRYLDWIAVMCYDYHGQWDKVTGHIAPMYTLPDDADAGFNANATMHYWIEKGAARKKLVMGMPLYGQSFSLAENTNHGLNAPTYGGGEAGEETRARGFLAYYEICQNVVNKGWTVVRDRKGRIGPYAYLRDQWVSFDDIAMIRHKSEYIKAMGLGGGMIWALDLDDFKNLCGCEEYPLLRTINRVLRNYSKNPDPKCFLGGKGTKQPPLTHRPVTTQITTSVRPEPTKPTSTSVLVPSTPADYPVGLPCGGRLFIADETNCQQYYICNQGNLMLQVCPTGLYWNKDHCDWPENTVCQLENMPNVELIEDFHPTTSDNTYLPPLQTTSSKPIYPVTISEGSSGLKVVCYFTNWAWYRQGDGKYLPEDVDPSLCTHIAYGFAVLDASTLTIKPHDSWADLDNNFYKKLTSYRKNGVKVSIALGGWNDSQGDKYSRLVNDPQARARFIKHVINFIEKWEFDGLDLDWEYPKCWQVECNKGPASDKDGFAALVRELSEEFRPRGLLLSAAVSPSKLVIDEGYDVPTLSHYFDWIAVMCYDYHGQWDKQTGHLAPLYYYPGDVYDYFNSNFSINYWIEKGAEPSKLIMGMPMYGQSFSLASTENKGLNVPSYGPGEAGEFTRAAGFLAFYEICERVKRNSWTVVRDPKGRIGPYAYAGNQWVSYDDISDIRRKAQFVKQLGLGGGMIWALDLDDFRNRCGCGKHPLLKTLNNELRGIPIDINLNNCT